MAKYVCTVCGYVYEGDAAPESCPVCKAPAEKFKLQEGERFMIYIFMLMKMERFFQSQR